MLSEQKFAPARSFSSVDEFEKCFHQYDTLIIDATQQPIQRPLDEYEQKANYSGKKKTHIEEYLKYSPIFGQCL